MKCKCNYCGKEINRKPSQLKKYKSVHCSRECFMKDRNLHGKNNPNYKYKKDEQFFKNIDSSEKAWVLGWIASDGHISSGGFTIHVQSRDVEVLEQIRNIICPSAPIKFKKSKIKNVQDQVSLTINSKTMSHDLASLLALTSFKKAYNIQFPYSIPKEYYYDFIRGYFEGDGSIRKPGQVRRSPECTISSRSNKMLDQLKDVCGNGKVDHKYHSISWSGLDCISFLSQLYEDASNILMRKRDLYFDWCNWKPSLEHKQIGGMKCNKTSRDAKIIYQNGIHHLFIIKEISHNSSSSLFSTGLRILPPDDYYLRLLPSAELLKEGWDVSNSTTIFDSTYPGEILVHLYKKDKNAKDLKLPFNAILVKIEKMIHMTVQEVKEF